MSPTTAGQLRTRRRVETLIRLMAPALDVVLAAGDRVSRIVERDDPEYYPPRVTEAERPPLPR
jgi:soluble P-type ATPase